MTESHIIQSTRVFPSVKHHGPRTVPLSILDASVARFSPTGAVWLFDGLPPNVKEEEFTAVLQASLVEALDSFPQLAGQLRWATVQPGGSHSERFNRPVIACGTESDPGVEWNIVKHPFTIASLTPPPADRCSGSGVWMGDAFPQNAMLSQTPLALHNLSDYEGLPAMLIQINLFEGGGYAVGIKMSHPLADAQSLLIFVNQWAVGCQSRLGSDPKALMGSPKFEPSELDSRAAGDIDGTAADPTVSHTARKLPLHRYDWWDTSGPGYNPVLIPTAENSRPPPEQLADAPTSPATRAPWETWDPRRPVTYALLHFSGAELDNMKAAARADHDGQTNVSRLDALLAHLFSVVNQARGHNHTSEEVFLDVTLDVRRRVSPPLPNTFIGSPLFLTHIKATGTEACTGKLGNVASKLRQTMNLFTPAAIGAMLHDMAFEVSPQRLWQAFVGTRHMLVTSWLRLPLQDIDFVGYGQKPRYAHPVMSKIDGIVQVMDCAVPGGGVDVGLYLDQDAMANLLRGENLRRFRGAVRL